MKTRAAVLRAVGQPFEITELELDEPKAGEVLIRYAAAGLCHSDEHLRHGDIVPRFPIVGGHEGAGVIEKVGPGVTRVKPGDHVICSFLPVCGHCRWCATGQSNLCDLGATILDGLLPDGTFRFHDDGATTSAGCACSARSPSGRSSPRTRRSRSTRTCRWTRSCSSAAACRPAGARRSTRPATEPGDTMVIYGIGGIGINGVQGAAHAGAAQRHRRRPAAEQARDGRGRSAPRTAARPPRRRTSWPRS